MAVAPPGDPEGPAERTCLACAIPVRDESTGEQLRDERGFPRYRCDLCVARTLDRHCECFLCPWLRDEGILNVE